MKVVPVPATPDPESARLAQALKEAQGSEPPSVSGVKEPSSPAPASKDPGDCEVCKEGGVSIYKAHGFAVDWKQVGDLIKAGKSTAEALMTSTIWEPESRLCAIFMREVFWAEVKRQEDRGALFPLKKALEVVRTKHPEGVKCLPVKFP